MQCRMDAQRHSFDLQIDERHMSTTAGMCYERSQRCAGPMPLLTVFPSGILLDAPLRDGARKKVDYGKAGTQAGTGGRHRSTAGRPDSENAALKGPCAKRRQAVIGAPPAARRAHWQPRYTLLFRFLYVVRAGLLPSLSSPSASRDLTGTPLLGLFRDAGVSPRGRERGKDVREMVCT